MFKVFALPHLVDGGKGVGVVGGKLGEDGILRAQQLAGTGEIGDVGVDFAGVNGVAVEPFYLRPFDFAVPIRAFNQPHHQALFVLAG